MPELTVVLYLASLTDSMGIVLWAGWYPSTNDAVRYAAVMLDQWMSEIGGTMPPTISVRGYVATRRAVSGA